MNSIKVRQLFDYTTWTYTYLLWCKETKQCLLIDPVLEQVDRDLGLINQLGLKLEYVFETHVHADHITGADTIRTKMDIKVVYGSRAGVNGCDICLEDNQTISLGKHNIKAKADTIKVSDNPPQAPVSTYFKPNSPPEISFKPIIG